MSTEKTASSALEWSVSSSSPKDRILEWVDRNMIVVFNIPTTAFLVGLIAFPAVLVLWTSMTDWQLITKQTSQFVGFANYINIWGEERWLRGIFNMFYFAVTSVVLQLIIGMATAMLFNRQFAGKTFYRSVWMMPMISMSVAISLVWAILFNSTYGLINYWLGFLGIDPIEWITTARWVMPSLIMVAVWQHTPFMTLILLAGLQSLPTEPYEAARIDGASRWQSFVNITLPLMRSHIIVATVLRSIFAMKQFDIILAISEGGPNYASETMNINIYFNAFEYGYMGVSSAKGVIFFLFILIIQLILVKLRRREWSY
jgi:multiple sugar transport system permease protein